MPDVPATFHFSLPNEWALEKPSEKVMLKPSEATNFTVAVRVAKGFWGRCELPATLLLHFAEQPLRLNTVVKVGSGFIRDWMAIGAFPNRSGLPLDSTIHPPEDGIDLSAEYDGIVGKVHFEPVHLQSNWLDFNALFKVSERATAYAIACVEADAATPAVLRISTSGGTALFFNGEFIWSQETAHPSEGRIPVTLQPGDNVLMFKVCSGESWRLSVEVEPLSDRFNGRARLIMPEQFAMRKVFAPPPKPKAPEVKQLKHTGGVDWKLIYADEFDRKGLGARWRIASGIWKIENGVLVGKGPSAFIAYAEKLRLPIRIEYDARSNQEACDLSAFWLTSPPNWRENGILIGFGSNNNTCNKLLINGEQVFTSQLPLIEQGKWHHIIAQILPSGRAQLIVNEQSALDYKAERLPADARYAGLWLWGSGEFDNVRIYVDLTH